MLSLTLVAGIHEAVPDDDMMEYGDANFSVINFSGLRDEGGGGISQKVTRLISINEPGWF